MNKRFNYNYSIDQCDILDKKKGEAFREKRLQWMEWLNGEDPHSISRQIYSMLWDYSLFLTVNELRKIADTEPQNGIGFNGPVIRLFDAGFATTQATTIRRLIEKPKSDPRWAIISLRRVLKDVEQNLDLITRENYVCYDGLPYDYDSVRQKQLASLPAIKSGVHASFLPTQGPDAGLTAEMIHENFDILAQVNPKKRTREDRMRIEVLEHLETEIKKCEYIKRYVDKFIAHATAPETRVGLLDEEKGLTLERLETCHKIIYQVASFISGSLLWESNLGGLPVPQDDHLNNLDKSWVSTKNLEIARKKWDEFTKEVSSWDAISLWPPDFTIDWKNKA
ncbi:MAG: hypothetical protein Q8R05_04215 [Candidatus Omnitrophota bacterium]|nr:hypothetical protein [Candidatus Omnitrophota bacterium]